ncbi:hypothetical protein K0P33_09800 [Pseudomonas sp. ArH3a]|uniref:hypothetical protein n=1 Tax=Pseudomonas sp. ArH3a TaxID=2862945 RepID=UPI001F59B488|nr:hypothetical protein [Pseudomonas sp. ArH3a]UNM21721.1 hypothetical protein K0P33_09800 [Pseudomonas sp. ArH3a]
MLYEKKKQRSREFVPLLCVEIALVVFLIWEIFYYYIDMPKAFWDIKFVDVANIVAQLATAGAFVLGFYQFNRSKSVDRQSVLVSECKAVILKMVAVIKDFDVGQETGVKNIKACCITLGGLGSDFNELFVELDESVNKGVVRMHWQSMFFNVLLKAMANLDLGAATAKEKILPESYLFALATAKVKIKYGPVNEGLEKYFTHLYVLQNDLMKDVRDRFEFSDLYQFILYFFEGEYTDDYMYGALSQLDVRTRAPLISAINDACKFKRLVRC